MVVLDGQANAIKLDSQVVGCFAFVSTYIAILLPDCYSIMVFFINYI